MARTDHSRFVSQPVLAAALDLTTRRIRQLVSDGILPKPRPDGGYNLDLCREQYALYQLRHEAGAWTEFENRLLDNARRAERALSAALKPTSTERQIQAGSLAVQGLFEDLKFMTVCRSRSQAERDFIMEGWRDREDRLLGLLLGRAFEIIALATGMTFDQVQDAITKDAA